MTRRRRVADVEYRVEDLEREVAHLRSLLGLMGAALDTGTRDRDRDTVQLRRCVPTHSVRTDANRRKSVVPGS